MDPQTDCRIMTLPAELRNEMYRLCLVEGRIRMPTIGRSTAPPALLQTCRLIRKESATIYFKENNFNFRIHSLDMTRTEEWVALSDLHANAKVSLGFRGQPKWENLLVWLEHFWEDRWLGFSDPNNDEQEISNGGSVVHHVFTIVEELKEAPEMTWEKVRTVLESVQQCVRRADGFCDWA